MGFSAGGALPDNVTLELDTGGNMRIKDLGVSAAKIAADAVTAPKIAAGAVGNDELAANAVGSGKIAANAVADAEIASHTTSKITSPLSRLDTTGTSRGDIIQKGAASFERFGAGATGNFLKSQGAGSDVAYDSAVSYDGGGDNAENYKILGAGVFKSNNIAGEVLKSISISAGEFTANDGMHIICGDGNDGGNAGNKLYVRISGTGITTAEIISINYGGGGNYRTIEGMFCQGVINTNIDGCYFDRSAASSFNKSSANLGLANWITGAFTLEFLSDNVGQTSGRACYIMVAKVKNLSAGTRGTATHNKSLAGGVFTGLASAGNLQSLSVVGGEMAENENYIIMVASPDPVTPAGTIKIEIEIAGTNITTADILNVSSTGAGSYFAIAFFGQSRDRQKLQGGVIQYTDAAGLTNNQFTGLDIDMGIGNWTTLPHTITLKDNAGGTSRKVIWGVFKLNNFQSNNPGANYNWLVAGEQTPPYLSGATSPFNSIIDLNIDSGAFTNDEIIFGNVIFIGNAPLKYDLEIGNVLGNAVSRSMSTTGIYWIRFVLFNGKVAATDATFHALEWSNNSGITNGNAVVNSIVGNVANWITTQNKVLRLEDNGTGQNNTIKYAIAKVNAV